ncbi:MAG: chromate resistance protein [Vulcanimicrobiaceae bacterium]
MQQDAERWLAFILSGAASDGSGRVRVWRALKALRPAILRDGVYVLPARPELERSLTEQRVEVQRAGGQAFVFALATTSEDDRALRRLFDRTSEFGTLVADLRQFANEDVLTVGETEARRALRALLRDYKALAATDYFPTDAHVEAKAALARADAAFVERFSPGEPQAVERDIPRLERSNFQNRLWATRERLWVDRISSAWLIRTFVDTGATFRWLSDVRDCPSDAVGFDFDGATFTHVGDAVTFEVLVRSFGLDRDPGLTLLGDLVRSLDIAGAPRSAEAAGFEALVVGARETCGTDDALLAALSPPLTFLHAAFARRPSRIEGER